MRRSDSSAPPRVLIVKLSSLGDLFHALPAVHNLKVGLGATVDWVVQEEYVDVVSCFTDVERVIPMSRSRFLRRFGSLVRELRLERYDYVVDLQGLLKSAFVSRLALAPARIGPSFHREGSRLFYTSIAGTRNRGRHAVEENLDVIRYLGLELLPVKFPVKFPSTSLDTPFPRVALVPVSRWESKNWPPSSFAEVGRRLENELGAVIYLFGADQDGEVCEEIRSSLSDRAIDLAGKTTLIESGGYLHAMDLVITNDSGPMHMAAALEVPTLAIFGPTDPRRTGPFGSMHRVISSDLACQPCCSRTCTEGTRRCISDIQPGVVADAALNMLGEGKIATGGATIAEEKQP